MTFALFSRQNIVCSQVWGWYPSQKLFVSPRYQCTAVLHYYLCVNRTTWRTSLRLFERLYPFKMAQIRETIEALCTVLNNHCPGKISAESFRLAKFDKKEATDSLWMTLHTVLTAESLKPSDQRHHNVAKFCKHVMFRKGYRVNEFFQLPADMSYGSRELMLALGWLMAKEDVVTKFINKLKPLIFEDPPVDFSLFEKIPLPLVPDHCTEKPTKKDCDAVDVADRLILKYNRLNSSLKNLLASRSEYTKIVCKLHSIPKAAKSHSSSHFSTQDVYFMRHPREMEKYQQRLEWFCSYAKALASWSANELTFWKWMESVLDAKIQNAIEMEQGIENTNRFSDNQLFKPSSTLQKAKERQVELSQILNAQEPVYRKVSKRWKKIKASLQSSEEGHEKLAEILSSLDDELLEEFKEVQKSSTSTSTQDKCENLKSKDSSLCFKKLTQGDLKTGQTSKEVIKKSMASKEIERLKQRKQVLERKLRSLQDSHKAKLFEISQAHPNLVCISPKMGNTL